MELELELELVEVVVAFLLPLVFRLGVEGLGLLLMSSAKAFFGVPKGEVMGDEVTVGDAGMAGETGVTG